MKKHDYYDALFSKGSEFKLVEAYVRKRTLEKTTVLFTNSTEYGCILNYKNIPFYYPQQNPLCIARYHGGIAPQYILPVEKVELFLRSCIPAVKCFIERETEFEYFGHIPDEDKFISILKSNVDNVDAVGDVLYMPIICVSPYEAFAVNDIRIKNLLEKTT